MNPVRSLIRVHDRRLEKAERHLAEARAELRARQEEQRQHEAALAAHRATAPEREREIYRRLFNHVVKRDALDLAKEEVMELRRQEVALEEALAHAERATAEAAAAAEAAQQAYLRQAARTEKYHEIDRHFVDLAKTVLERKEELEMEEVAMVMRR
jgi:hypothetical protein